MLARVPDALKKVVVAVLVRRMSAAARFQPVRSRWPRDVAASRWSWDWAGVRPDGR
jgi:hypothetical protein